MEQRLNRERDMKRKIWLVGLTVAAVFCLAFSLVECGSGEEKRAAEISEEGLEMTLNVDGRSYAVTGLAFSDDGNIVIPSQFRGLPVTIIGEKAFYNEHQITNVTIPSSVISIGYRAFSYCSSLASVTIQKGVTTIGKEAFYGCESLMGIEIPSSVTSIGTQAFGFCSNLANVMIEKGVTAISNGVFYCCGSLTSVSIPNSVTAIGKEAFFGCDSLTSIEIPSSVTAIGELVFWHCRGLESIILGKGVMSIGYNVFSDCESLTNVYYRGTPKNWEQISINSTNATLFAATRYYYCEGTPTAEQWDSSENWWHYDGDEIAIWGKN